MRKTLIIAEAGVNHNGSIQLAKQLIDVAAEAGVDFVKFQTFKANKLVTRKAQKASYQVVNLNDGESTQFEMLKKLELSADDHQVLIDYCNAQNVNFLSTAFDLESLDYLESVGIAYFKIPSGEITNLPFLEQIGKKNKQVILSTGMSTLGEIEAALEVLLNMGTAKENITVLHCNTEYPTPFEDVNLSAMNTIQKAFDVNIGYSDHSLGIEVPIAAVALGATVIEKHFTLDRSMEGPDHSASLEPQELIAMVAAIRNIEKAMGNGRKIPSPSESKNKPIARKSIHLAKDLTQGHVLQLEDLVMKRPGHGISPMQYKDCLGKELRKDLQEDDLLKWSDIQ